MSNLNRDSSPQLPKVSAKTSPKVPTFAVDPIEPISSLDAGPSGLNALLVEAPPRTAEGSLSPETLKEIQRVAAKTAQDTISQVVTKITNRLDGLTLSLGATSQGMDERIRETVVAQCIPCKTGFCNP